MKVLFLDFDGVIVTLPNLRKPNPRLLALVRHIVEMTGAKIVVSSAWRSFRSIDELSKLIGLEVYDVTPDLAERDRRTIGSHLWVAVERGDEIHAWLSDHSLSVGGGDYVVLDDDSDRGPIPESRWLKTEFRTGVTANHAAQAIALLGGAE